MDEQVFKVVFYVEDCYANPRKKYGEIGTGATWLPVEKAEKYVDTKKSYYHTYYFSSQEKANEFFDELWKKYHIGE